MKNKKIPPIHPGEILDLEFLKPMGLSQNKLALALGVSPRRINEIVLGKRRITANTALRLAKYFNMTPQYWLGLQMDYDLDVEQDQLADRLDQEINVPRKNWAPAFKKMAMNHDDKLID
jgi:addiction module HigA family antidote